MKGVAKLAPGEGHVAYAERPDVVAGPGEVVIDLLAAGICGTDLHIAAGEYPCLPPVTMGHEFCGRVAELGPGVESDWADARVTSETFFSTCGCAAGVALDGRASARSASRSGRTSTVRSRRASACRLATCTGCRPRSAIGRRRSVSRSPASATRSRIPRASMPATRCSSSGRARSGCWRRRSRAATADACTSAARRRRGAARARAQLRLRDVDGGSAVRRRRARRRRRMLRRRARDRHGARGHQPRRHARADGAAGRARDRALRRDLLQGVARPLGLRGESGRLAPRAAPARRGRDPARTSDQRRRGAGRLRARVCALARPRASSSCSSHRAGFEPALSSCKQIIDHR